MVLHQLETASIGYPITRRGVSLFPVYVRQHPAHVATGAAAGTRIVEKPDATVPTLQVHNPGGSPVLLVAGETVLGGRQNRVLNVSVLVPAATVLDVPVSCVEQGRWNAGHGFSRSDVFAPRRVRRETTRTVHRSIAADGSRHSDQSAVWESVRAELARLDAVNPTGSLDGVRARLDRGDQLARAADGLVRMGPLPGQCGIVVAHGRRVVAVDVLASPDMLACHWSALVRSHLIDAPEQPVGAPSATAALRFLHGFAGTRAQITPGVGLGREHHIDNAKVTGQALVWDDVLVHASAFALAA
jgi:hypothetical protein